MIKGVLQLNSFRCHLLVFVSTPLSDTLKEEVQTLVLKNAIEPVPPEDRGSGFSLGTSLFPRGMEAETHLGLLKPESIHCIQEIRDGLPIQQPDSTHLQVGLLCLLLSQECNAQWPLKR